MLKPSFFSRREMGPGQDGALLRVTQLSHTSSSSCRKGGSENQKHMCPSRRASELLRGARGGGGEDYPQGSGAAST